MTRFRARLDRLEDAAGLRLPHDLPLDQWSDHQLCQLLGVADDVSIEELDAIINAQPDPLTKT